MKPPKPAASKSGSLLLEEGRGGGRVAGEQGLGYGEAMRPERGVVLAAVAAVGEVAGDGLGSGLRGGGGVAGVRLDVGEDGPGRSTAKTRGRTVRHIRSPGGFPAALRPGGGACVGCRRDCSCLVPSFATSRISTDLSAACRQKAAASSGRSRTYIIQVSQLHSACSPARRHRRAAPRSRAICR